MQSDIFTLIIKFLFFKTNSIIFHTNYSEWGFVQNSHFLPWIRFPYLVGTMLLPNYNTSALNIPAMI